MCYLHPCVSTAQGAVPLSLTYIPMNNLLSYIYIYIITTVHFTIIEGCVQGYKAQQFTGGRTPK